MVGYAHHTGRAGGVAAATGVYGIKVLSLCNDISDAYEIGDAGFMAAILAEATEWDYPGCYRCRLRNRLRRVAAICAGAHRHWHQDDRPHALYARRTVQSLSRGTNADNVLVAELWPAPGTRLRPEGSDARLNEHQPRGPAAGAAATRGQRPPTGRFGAKLNDLIGTALGRMVVFRFRWFGYKMRVQCPLCSPPEMRRYGVATSPGNPTGTPNPRPTASRPPTSTG